MKKTERNVMGIPVFSKAAFERETGLKLIALSGKLADLFSYSGSKTNNPFCANQCAKCIGVCAGCYADGCYKFRITAKAAHERYTEILESDILTCLPDLSKVDAPFIRFNSHGELAGLNTAINELLIAAANPSVKFGLWTKRPELIAQAIEQIGFRPANVSLVYSSYFVDNAVKLADVNKMFCVDFDHVFTVYKPENMPDNKTAYTCKCGPKACVNCGVCYNRFNGVEQIAEKLR